MSFIIANLETFIVAVVFVALFLLLFIKERKINPKAWYLILGFMILLYFVTYFTLSLQKYWAFQTSWPADLAFHNQALWDTLHGDGFFVQKVFSWGHATIFTQHAYFWAPLIMPLYLIWPRIEGLLFWETLVLASGAIPLFLFGSRRIKSKTIGLIIALCYLIYPLLGKINLADFRFEPFAITFLIWAFYFFDLRKAKPFILFAILAILAKENIALIVACFGIYALFQKRSWQWVVLPIVFGFGYFFLSLKMSAYLLAHSGIREYRQGQMESHLSLIDYKQWGNNFGEVVQNLIKNPNHTYNYLISQNKLQILINQFRPVGFLPLLSPISLLFMLPTVLKNHLLDREIRDFMGNTLIYYNSGIVPFIFLGTAMVIGYFKNHWLKIVLALLVLTTSIIFFRINSTTPLGQNWPKEKKMFAISNKTESIWKAINKVPRNETVATNQLLMAALSDRKVVLAGNYNIFLPNEMPANYIIYAGKDSAYDIEMANKIVHGYKEWKEIYNDNNQTAVFERVNKLEIKK